MKTVWVADLHVGSQTALANPDETPKHCVGKPIQEKLYAAWKSATSGPHRKPDALVVVGDAIDGQGRKSGGVDQWTTNIYDQIGHAKELIQMWKAKKVYILGGSKYHVALKDTGWSAEEQLGRDLGAEPYPNQDHIPEGRRYRSGPHWFLTFEGVTVHFAHHIGVSRVFHYMSTPIAREMMKAKLNDPMKHLWEKAYREWRADPNPDVDLLKEIRHFKTRIVVRGHAHYWWLCDGGASTGMILPAWKCPDSFIIERDPLGYGHIGYAAVTCKDGVPSIEKHLFPIETIAAPPHSVV